MSKNSINTFIEKNFQRKQDYYKSLLYPTVGFFKTNTHKNGSHSSKVGGMPFLPKHFKYPSLRGKPLSFVCQINLNEIHRFETSNKLPSEGMLYFFILEDETIDDRYPTKKEEFKVVYLSKIDESFTYFDNKPVMIEESYIEFFQTYSIPSYNSYKRMGENKDDEYNIDEEIQEFIDSQLNNYSFQISMLTGEPQPIQNSVYYDWVVNSLEIDMFTEPDVKTEEKIDSIQEQYVQLLQLDLCEFSVKNNLIDSSSRLYFGIKKNDLEIQDFDNIELVIQHT